MNSAILFALRILGTKDPRGYMKHTGEICEGFRPNETTEIYFLCQDPCVHGPIARITISDQYYLGGRGLGVTHLL